MKNSHITWRGSLRSCNYTCVYCPFAKQQTDRKALLHDQSAFDTFIKKLSLSNFSGSILLAPYGEGLIHPYYQERYGYLSQIPEVSMVSCQTNLSWNVADFLASLKKQKADFSRLALWATLHPSMTDTDVFIEKCQELSAHLRLCVGMVGNPDDIAIIETVKQKLPAKVGFWINKMDGLTRPYTAEELQIFSGLDALFPLEQKRFAADSLCHGSFIDSKGHRSLCNRSKTIFEETPSLLRKSLTCRGICDCFLAYSNRKDIPQLLHLGPYPQLRLPWIPPQALFLDFDGTIAAKGRITTDTAKWLQALSRRYRIYLMTGRTEENVKRVFHGKNYLSGGIFSYGAEIRDYGTGQKHLTPLPQITKNAQQTYLVDNLPIKQIFARRSFSVPSGCRFIKDGIFSMIAAQANKLYGVKLLCQWNGWNQDEVLVYGNGHEDISVLEHFPYSIAPLNAHEIVLDKAHYHMNFEILADMLLS